MVSSVAVTAPETVYKGVDLALTEPVQNWNDLRLQLVWAYNGAIPRSARGVYPGYPIAAWYLRRGSVMLQFGSHRRTYGSGCWIFPPAKEGRQEFSEDTLLLSLRFVAEWPTGESLFDRSKTYVFPSGPLQKLTRVGERLASYTERKFPGGLSDLQVMPGSLRSHVEMQRLFFGWILEYIAVMERNGLVAHAITHIDPRVRQAVHLLESRPIGQPLREREFAQQVGLSVSHLHKLFVQTLGITPTGYWERKRVHTAQLALLESSQSAKSIAYTLGFKSLSHFSLWITKRLGKSPREIRRSLDR